MFNRKKIEELELRIWALENPCKFNVGDKLRDGGFIIKTELVTTWGNEWRVTGIFNDGIIYTWEQKLWDAFKIKNN